jgi:hypothetical protein
MSIGLRPEEDMKNYVYTSPTIPITEVGRVWALRREPKYGQRKLKRMFYTYVFSTAAAASGRQSPPIRLCCVSVTLDEPEQDVHVVFLASLL